jgi:hypothetical protein
MLLEKPPTKLKILFYTLTSPNYFFALTMMAHPLWVLVELSRRYQTI